MFQDGVLTMNSQETYYLVEYATVATYYKIEATNRDEATTKMYDGRAKGIESQDRIDVEIHDADVEEYDAVKTWSSLSTWQGQNW